MIIYRLKLKCLFVISFLALLLVLAGCGGGSVGTGIETVSYQGNIRNSENQPVAGVRVTAQTRDSVSRSPEKTIELSRQDTHALDVTSNIQTNSSLARLLAEAISDSEGNFAFEISVSAGENVEIILDNSSVQTTISLGPIEEDVSSVRLELQENIDRSVSLIEQEVMRTVDETLNQAEDTVSDALDNNIPVDIPPIEQPNIDIPEIEVPTIDIPEVGFPDIPGIDTSN